MLEIQILEFQKQLIENRECVIPSLLPGRIHIWQAQQNDFQASYETLNLLLSPDERVHARRFRFENDKLSYILGHAMIKQLSAQYLKSDASQIQLTYAKNNKPQILHLGERTYLRFNISHSGEYVLAAFAYHQEIGVDIEKVRIIEEFDTLRAKVLSLQENTLYKRLTIPEQERLFFQMWVRKEAVLKAMGNGLDYPGELNEISIIPNRKHKNNSYTIYEKDSRLNSLWLQDISAPPGYTAAACVSRSRKPSKELKIHP